eukprot:1058247-Rhodomonas_salina.1
MPGTDAKSRTHTVYRATHLSVRCPVLTEVTWDECALSGTDGGHVGCDVRDWAYRATDLEWKLE